MTALKVMMNVVYAVVITQAVQIVLVYQTAEQLKMSAAYVMVLALMLPVGMVLWYVMHQTVQMSLQVAQ